MYSNLPSCACGQPWIVHPAHAEGTMKVWSSVAKTPVGKVESWGGMWVKVKIMAIMVSNAPDTGFITWSANANLSLPEIFNGTPVDRSLRSFSMRAPQGQERDITLQVRNLINLNASCQSPTQITNNSNDSSPIFSITPYVVSFWVRQSLRHAYARRVFPYAEQIEETLTRSPYAALRKWGFCLRQRRIDKALAENVKGCF